MSNRFPSYATVTLLIALCLSLAFIALRQTKRAAALAEELDAEKTNTKLLKDSRRRDAAEIAQAHQQLAQVVASGQRDDLTRQGEDELDGWIHRVGLIQSFVKKHPEWSIPELKSLNMLSWLDAAKDKDLRTEADFRRALAKLRLDAKKSELPTLAEAAKAYKAESGKDFATSSAEYAKFAAVDPEVLRRYEVNPGGKLEGIQFSDNRPIVLVERPVDPLWDYQFAVTSEGNTVSTPLSNPVVEKVTASVAAFTARTGTAPSLFGQIAEELPPGERLLAEQAFIALKTPVP